MIIERVKLFEGFVLQEMKSSNLSQVAHCPEENLLRVSFKKGGVYQYAGVSEEVMQEWLKADSKGSFFYKNISKSYSFIKLTIIEEGKDNGSN